MDIIKRNICCCFVNQEPTSRRRKRDEIIFYDSSDSKRSCLGSCYYKWCCPAWHKVTSRRVIASVWRYWDICGLGMCSCPCGRTTDTFDADTIVDLQVYQSCCQICLAEGDLTFIRNAATDMTHQDPEFTVRYVPDIFNLFDKLTSYLAQNMNLKGYRRAAMGAALLGDDGRVVDRGMRGIGDDVNADGGDTGIREETYFDSSKAQRTCIGWLIHLDCCFPSFYKVTNHRVIYSKWLYCNCICCSVPSGRTVDYFDMDILVDLQADQRCTQICINEGDLKLIRMAGGDKNNSDIVFTAYGVPEAYAVFDDLSYDLSTMNLKNFVQAAEGRDMSLAPIQIGMSRGLMSKGKSVDTE